MQRLIKLLPDLSYDLCVLTGDYRGKTFGPFQPALEGMKRLTAHLRPPVLGVLGNHDTIKMLPGLEAMGIRVLQNECATIERGDQEIYVAGIDDAHYFRVDNIERVGLDVPEGAFSILLSHTPGDLPAGGACRLRCLAQRAHARRADLSSRIYSHYADFSLTASDGGGCLALSRHARPYVRRCWIERR